MQENGEEISSFS